MIVVGFIEIRNNDEQGVVFTSNGTLRQDQTMWEASVVIVGVVVQIVQVAS